MSRAAAGQPLAACHAALAPMPRRRPVPGRDDARDRLLARAYDGLASYAQYLDARQTLDQSCDDTDAELRDEMSLRIKTYARDALEKWDGLVDVPGVWDVFIVKQVVVLFFFKCMQCFVKKDNLSRHQTDLDNLLIVGEDTK